MNSIHELVTLQIEDEKFTSFVDQTSREDLKNKIPKPSGRSKVGQYFVVKAVDDNGNITEVETTTDPIFTSLFISGIMSPYKGVYINDEGTQTEPKITFYGINGDEPVCLGNIADPVREGDAVPKAWVEKQIKDFSQNIDLSGYARTKDLPTKTSELKNDSGFITTAPVDSVNGKTGAVTLSASDVGALPSTYTPPDQTAAQVGADPAGTAEGRVLGHNVDTAAHNDLRLELKALSDRLSAFFDSDDSTLDELSEIVAYILSNKTLIEAITTSKVSVTDVIDNLITNAVNKPLSAAQGVVLKGMIDTLTASLSGYQPKGDYALNSAIPTKASQLQNDAGYLTEHQDISGKLDANKLPEAINAALAQAKASGVFDGAPGTDGLKGSDGITPHIGGNGNWFIGETDTGRPSCGAPGRDGNDGQDGYTPVKGVDYFDGAPGEPGKTPVKGTDYWTSEDKTDMINSVLAALPTWTGGSY